MSIRVRVVHQTPGRLRLQLAERHGDRPFFDEVSRRIAESGEVRSVRANPVTGSIVLEFAGEPAEQIARLSRAVPLEIVAPPARQGRSPLAAAGPPFKLVSDRDINPMLVAGAMFGAVGVMQTLRGQVLIPSMTAFWYAANAFRLARTAPTSEGGAVTG